MVKICYLGIDSFLSRIDALNKFLELVAVAFLAYVITDPLQQLTLLLILSLVILFLGKVPLRTYLSGMGIFLTFGFILLVMQVLLYAGPETGTVSLFGIILRKAAWRYGTNLGLRVFVIGSSVLSFIMTTEPRRIIYDMVERVKIPYRFAYGFYSALRFIPIFEEEARNILNAHAIRGTNTFEKGLINKAKIVIRIGAPLLISGLKKAKTSAIAMEARAFGAYSKRTQTVVYDVSWKGYVFGLLPWAIFIAYFILAVVLTNSFGFLQT
ncbi:MAG: energy-coupling factor transporter transmembrane component T [Bacillota bacterium]